MATINQVSDSARRAIGELPWQSVQPLGLFEVRIPDSRTAEKVVNALREMGAGEPNIIEKDGNFRQGATDKNKYTVDLRNNALRIDNAELSREVSTSIKYVRNNPVRPAEAENASPQRPASQERLPNLVQATSDPDPAMLRSPAAKRLAGLDWQREERGGLYVELPDRNTREGAEFLSTLKRDLKVAGAGDVFDLIDETGEAHRNGGHYLIDDVNKRVVLVDAGLQNELSDARKALRPDLPAFKDIKYVEPPKTGLLDRVMGWFGGGDAKAAEGAASASKGMKALKFAGLGVFATGASLALNEHAEASALETAKNLHDRGTLSDAALKDYQENVVDSTRGLRRANAGNPTPLIGTIVGEVATEAAVREKMDAFASRHPEARSPEVYNALNLAVSGESVVEKIADKVRFKLPDSDKASEVLRPLAQAGEELEHANDAVTRAMADRMPLDAKNRVLDKAEENYINTLGRVLGTPEGAAEVAKLLSKRELVGIIEETAGHNKAGNDPLITAYLDAKKAMEEARIQSYEQIKAKGVENVDLYRVETAVRFNNANKALLGRPDVIQDYLAKTFAGQEKASDPSNSPEYLQVAGVIQNKISGMDVLPSDEAAVRKIINDPANKDVVAQLVEDIGAESVAAYMDVEPAQKAEANVAPVLVAVAGNQSRTVQSKI